MPDTPDEIPKIPQLWRSLSSNIGTEARRALERDLATLLYTAPLIVLYRRF
jgi:hypothetical protein